eukprot:CAMPEP_0198138832 /NCGR_PEP_ID=MMETSP1443-20131203/2216_1 /TAXON_ID=186043 /ORGANISM="Entomoneis sp., Strain CCMP2396" /LENGTH=479 /DNA_ID=CAMNT_0043800771 /DNA_START=249 /DNA_END=1688 /DNA_ORIENTATION=+
MWGALANDLNVFVSTVAGDTSEALNNMDENFNEGEELSPAEEERVRRMEMRETFDSPLISDDDPDDYKKDVSSYLADFSIDSKTDEIAKLLEENPDTLKLAFEALVPTKVAYEEFWKCYFFRCDIDRIEKEIEEEEKEEAVAREKALKSLSSVGNFFGGAVKAVSQSLSEDDKGVKTDKPFQLTQNQVAKAGLFGSGGRPPFVMNTAVSDDDEEELGWDDDDEEEEEGDDQDGADDQDDHQIEFNDAVTEKLQEELKNAIEERDQLHDSIEMQKKEIASLKSQGAENAQMENLKTQLFEKDSEIAALRASALDSSGMIGGNGHDQGSSDEEVKRLANAFSEMEERLAAEVKAHEDAKSHNAELMSKVSELEAASRAASEGSAALEGEKKSLEEKLVAAEKRAQSLEEELHRLDETLGQKEDHKKEDHGEEEHEKEDHEEEDHGEESVDSPVTDASGVKIEAPAAQKAGDPEAVGWDDDW